MSEEILSRKNLDVKVVDTKGKEVPVPNEYIACALKKLNEDHYIDAALRSSHTNEVFIFCYRAYLVITYDPTSPGKGQVVKGPLLLMDGFPTLYHTRFSQFGVDAAFGCHGVNEAYLFSGPLCVKIEYGPLIRMGNRIGGYPSDIGFVFPCLESIRFVGSIDAAFESTNVEEAYLFKGSKYALINYNLKTLITTGLITDAFPCLLNTKFATDIKAAFASHLSNQAYLFKDDNSYVLVHYTPGNPSDSYIISGPEEMVPSNWPALQGIAPYKRRSSSFKPKTWTPVWRKIDYGLSEEAESEIEPDMFGPNGLCSTELAIPPPRVRI